MSLLSVGIPCHNSSKYIEKTIESVLNQTLKNIELFVYDNASTDNTEYRVQKYLELPNFHYIKRSENIGALGNWNSCITSGNGEYVAILHSDDLWLPTHAEESINMLEQHKNCVLSYCPAIWINDDDKVIQVMNHIGHRRTDYWGGRNEMAELMVYDCYVTTSSVIFRRGIIEKAGLFGKYLSTDYEYFCRIASINSDWCFKINPTIYYRWHETQDSNRFYASNEPIIGHVTLLHDLLQHYGGKEKMIGYEQRIWSLLMNRSQQYQEGAFGLGFMMEKISETLQRMVEKQ